MATHASVLAWRIPGTGSLVGCRLWGRTQSDMTEVTQQQHTLIGRYLEMGWSLKVCFLSHSNSISRQRKKQRKPLCKYMPSEVRN